MTPFPWDYALEFLGAVVAVVFFFFPVSVFINQSVNRGWGDLSLLLFLLVWIAIGGPLIMWLLWNWILVVIG